jgi:trehalose synthase
MDTKSSRLEHVPIVAMAPERFAEVLSEREFEALTDLIFHASRELYGRVIWNVNSTAKGGGVAEMLKPLVGYCRGADVDARWVVISGEPAFFEVTKRLHNRLHGFGGDGGPLGDDERATYERTIAGNATELVGLLKPNDVVILHDPQTAGLVDVVRETGALVIWRCHVGLDEPTPATREAWDFLRPYVLGADAYVFSRAGFAWDDLPRDRTTVIRPSIDAFSPKNEELGAAESNSILSQVGILDDEQTAQPTFTRSDGSPGVVTRSATMVQEQPMTAGDRIIVQVSRWDQLKDPLGVLQAFTDHVTHHDTHLMLAGPSTEAVADDPEGAQVYEAVTRAWQQLPDLMRRRVHLASLPMDDIEENAAMVNAIQRRANVVVQKSLAEGFGLTVSEAMWKQRPVVASRIGGIRDQIEDGRSGLLISNPRDLRQAGSAITGLLADPARAAQIGIAAQNRVRQQFLAPHHLGRYFEVIRRIVARRRHESA